jgi:hypothetical protein
MFRITKSVLSFGAVAVAGGVLTLAVPRAAHAVAAALVQVVNTTANPAITQDTSKQASQIVTLVCRPVISFPTPSACIQMDGRGHFSATQPYAVPSNSNFVLTGFDYFPNGAASGQGSLALVDQNGPDSFPSVFETLGVADFSQAFTVQFPSGIVFSGTAEPAILPSTGAGVQFIYLHGYLTSN